MWCAVVVGVACEAFPVSEQQRAPRAAAGAEVLAARLADAAARTALRRSGPAGDSEAASMKTVAHVPGEGDRVEVFVPVTEVWTVLHQAIIAAQVHHHVTEWNAHDADEELLASIRTIHECLDPLATPELDDGTRVWAVDPQAMWDVVTDGAVLATATGDVRRSVENVAQLLGIEFPELPETGELDHDQTAARVSGSVAAHLGGAQR